MQPSQIIACELRGDLKFCFHYPLYSFKYVVTFTIFEKTGQAINLAMSCLWDIERDTYSTYNFENTELIAVGTVFGIYYE